MARALVPLASGFEEIEAVTIVDVLRRAGVEVVLAGLTGPGPVEGAHGIVVQASAGLATAGETWDLIVLPGGEPGTTHLAADTHLVQLLVQHAAASRPLAALCAAPRILAAAGLLRDRNATSFPDVESALRAGGARYSNQRVVRDGSIVTSRGPGTALEFALACLDLLGLGPRAAELRRTMLVAEFA